jgi:hypothetical protein
MPYAYFLRISLPFVFCIAFAIILAFSAIYFSVSVYFPYDGVLLDKAPILPGGFQSSTGWEITTAAFQCMYFSAVTFGSLGHADLIPGATAKFFVVLELIFGVSTVGMLVAKIVSLPVDQIRLLRRGIIDSWWIDRVEKGISETEDLFGLLKFETHGIYGVRYHGTDYNKSGKIVGGFGAFLTQIEMPSTEFRVPVTYTKDHGPALVSLTFYGERRTRFNHFEGQKLDLTKPQQRQLVEGWKVTDQSDLRKLNNPITRNQAVVELIGRHFPERAA